MRTIRAKFGDDNIGYVFPGYCLVELVQLERFSDGGIALPDVKGKVDEMAAGIVVRCGQFLPQGRNMSGEGELYRPDDPRYIPPLEPGTFVWFSSRAWQKIGDTKEGRGIISTFEIKRAFGPNQWKEVKP